MKKILFLCIALGGMLTGRVYAQYDPYEGRRTPYASCSEVLDRTYDGFMYNAPLNIPTPYWNLGGHQIPWGTKFAGMRYSPASPVVVYGVAVTTIVACISLSDTEYQNPYFTDSIRGTLLYKDSNGQYVTIASGRMRPYFKHAENDIFKPSRYFYYGYGYNDIDTIVVKPSLYSPLVEFYFDGPIEIGDTFYVGIAANDLGLVPIDYLCGDLGNHTPSIRENLLFLSDTGILAPRGYDNMLVWGGFFPIVRPYDELEDIRNDTVQNFRLENLRVGYPTFAWNTDAWGRDSCSEEEDLLYEVQYAPLGSDAWETVSTADSSVRVVAMFDTGRYYQARIRAYRHHSCPMHDTMMWGMWGHGIQFYTGLTPPDTTHGGEDTTVVDSTGIGPMAGQFTYLMPNPATDVAFIFSSFPMQSVAVFDAAGHCVLQRRGDERTVKIDLAGFAKGTYHVVVQTAAGKMVKRLVVQ